MKGFCQIIGFGMLVSILFMGCKGEGTLLDLYPMEPIVNPEVGTLIRDNQILFARLQGRHRLSGITERGTFHTEDRFKSLDFLPAVWPATPVEPVAFGERVVVRAVMEGHALILFTSADNGGTWTRFSGDVVPNGTSDQGPVRATGLWLQNDRTVWVLGQHQVGSDRHALLYRVDLVAQSSTLMLRRPGERAIALAGLPGGQVWTVTAGWEQRQRVQLTRSVDGGAHWVDGASVSGIESPRLVVVDVDRVILHGSVGAALHSEDGGASFSAIDINANGMWKLFAASGDVVYATTSGGVAKSVDGGKVWTTLKTDVHGMQVVAQDLHFLDERQGIVYGEDRLFLTDDGGESWKILIYPYDYVFE